MSDFFKEGVAQALRDHGFKVAEDFEEGTPYPDKNPVINAEALALRLREDAEEYDEESREAIPADNPSYTWDRPVTWQSPVNLSGLDSGAGASGISTPG